MIDSIISCHLHLSIFFIKVIKKKFNRLKFSEKKLKPIIYLKFRLAIDQHYELVKAYQI